MTAAPPPVDRAAASRAAVAARRARAEVKRAIASGERPTVEVLDASADPANAAEHSLRVTNFLLAIPHIGQTKMTRILEQLAISPSKRLGGLGVKQRERLREFLVRRGGAVAPAALTVLAGPTAVGKGTVAGYVRDHYPEVALAVSVTTRAPRPGEIEGVHYHFVSDTEFDRLVDDDELLEYATVHNSYRYGTPRSSVRAALERGRPVLLEIDLQGARQVRERMPEARLVFLAPPSWDELVRRLVGRGTESAEEQARRLRTAEVELAAQDEFDELVVNDTVPEAAGRLVHLMGLTKEHA
ncbi:guanylate kinase [Pseudoclavibacter chungangensis]|uniref:Guanylate kinase n=1 Tax=Pseudoclavibacter chungangensis TaxID=587635 RepID=A0A7J5BU31_9MICO|nr:guanylate kinase [Pseudoclavibacter chungangensis]KAB1657845.1 guanylate kinase [Pseudoclavibacter chungangensis]NYJ66555.1 guanylate kinase [Pseudoclavibacter chungangensis]